MVKDNTNLYYNIGSSNGFSNLEIVKTFEKILDKDLGIGYD